MDSSMHWFSILFAKFLECAIAVAWVCEELACNNSGVYAQGLRAALTACMSLKGLRGVAYIFQCDKGSLWFIHWRVHRFGPKTDKFAQKLQDSQGRLLLDALSIAFVTHIWLATCINKSCFGG